jgi:hypothetical protein
VLDAAGNPGTVDSSDVTRLLDHVRLAVEPVRLAVGTPRAPHLSGGAAALLAGEVAELPDRGGVSVFAPCGILEQLLPPLRASGPEQEGNGSRPAPAAGGAGIATPPPPPGLQGLRNSALDEASSPALAPVWSSQLLVDMTVDVVHAPLFNAALRQACDGVFAVLRSDILRHAFKVPAGGSAAGASGRGAGEGLSAPIATAVMSMRHAADAVLSLAAAGGGGAVALGVDGTLDLSAAGGPAASPYLQAATVTEALDALCNAVMWQAKLR